MNKRGSNVDIIISFMIFISFLVFFYAMTSSSMRFQQDKSSDLNYLQEELTKNMTSNLTIISVLTNSPGSTPNSLKLLGMVDNLNNLEIPLNIVVANSTGTVFNSVNSGSDLYIDTSSGTGNPMLFDIYYSPLFNTISSGTLTSPQSLKLNANTNNYTIEQVQEMNYLFDFNIIQLIDEYDSNYTGVKNQLNLPPTDNFGFNFTYQNLTSIGTNDPKKIGTVVYSKLFPVLYLDKNSSIQEGNLIIRVW